ncbi:hypothetical protein KSS87_006636 [Heliosperma pusillum]|nr:hypothetical protein KSS87_006636 [Heliosperma pusillum]
MARLQSSINVIVDTACRNFYGGVSARRRRSWRQWHREVDHGAVSQAVLWKGEEKGIWYTVKRHGYRCSPVFGQTMVVVRSVYGSQRRVFGQTVASVGEWRWGGGRGGEKAAAAEEGRRRRQRREGGSGRGGEEAAAEKGRRRRQRRGGGGRGVTAVEEWR